MPSSRVSNSEFIERLGKLYASASTSGSIYLTSKRLTHADALSEVKDAQGDTSMQASSSSSSSSSSPHPILFRATNGASDSSSKVNISTIVPSSSILAFQQTHLSPLLRSTLSTSLRKRDKAKERKADKVLQARRKKDEELGGSKGVVKLGSKRGRGHRTRQRAEKRAAKLRIEERKERKRARIAAAASAVVAASANADGVPGKPMEVDGLAGAGTASTAANATQQQQQQQQQQQSSAASKKKKKKGKK